MAKSKHSKPAPKKSAGKKPTPTKNPESSARLWDKGKAMNELALQFTVGDDHIVDSGMIGFDLLGTYAHAVTLEASGVLTEQELKQIEGAIFDLLQRFSSDGDLEVSLEQEDSHTFIEQELTKALGPLGLKIHTGRSRNDQAVTMLRIGMQTLLAATIDGTVDVIESLCLLAERHSNAPMPGYTHMQRAMPSSVAAWALGYAEVLCERGEAMLGLRRHIGRNPLGSGAGYGVPLRLDRHASRESLGFKSNQAVTAVQLTRGLDELACCQSLHLLGIVISRMAADLVLFATREYGFCRLPAELTTGSSIMPQKANPDLFELMRAKGAELAGHSAAISAIVSGLPGGYQRDLQISKRHMSSAFDEAGLLLEATALAVGGVVFDEAACRKAMSPELYATAAAYRLVRQGMPFREAYRKAAADPTLWAEGFSEPGAEVADSSEYTDRLREDVLGRARALEEAVSMTAEVHEDSDD